MSKIIKYGEIVEDILIRFPETRDDDYLLYLYVCERVSSYGEKIRELPFQTVMANPATLGLPVFGTVTRSRRRVQQHNPKLLGERQLERLAREEEIRQEMLD